MGTIDIVVSVGYILLIVFLGLWVSRDKKGEEKTAKDYFLAGGTLPWWAVGTSLIASNISAEQLIGMSGQGYEVGMAIAVYELMAAAALILIAKFFLPIFKKHQIFTMPEFLEKRFGRNVRSALALFWLVLYVFGNLTVVMHLGAVAIEGILGWNYWWAVIGLAAFAAVYSLYGGLKAVAWTDVVQVVVLLLGGLITTYVAIDMVSDGSNWWSGMTNVYEQARDKFHFVLPSGHPKFNDLPGFWVLINGVWVANLFYWGCNQYITQRSLAAKSIEEAQKGILFAGYLKLLMPIVVVLPGIAAYVFTQGSLDGQADKAYPTLLAALPTGVKGLAIAALIAAIVSSLSSMLNSISTLFTMDIYKNVFKPDVTDKNLVKIGRIAAGAALIIAVLITEPLLRDSTSAFQFIQSFTGYFSPGILVIFLFGFFSKRATTKGAIVVAILSLPFTLAAEKLLGGVELMAPFLNRMAVVFVLLSIIMYLISMSAPVHPKALNNKGLFRTSTGFNVMSTVLVGMLILIYWIWW